MAPTIIAPGITIEGELSSDDEIEISGTIKGKIVSKESISINAGAVVEAEVSASSVLVAGHMTGNVSAQDRIDLQTGSRLVGDVKTSRLTIADGASFKGNVDMDVLYNPIIKTLN